MGRGMHLNNSKNRNVSRDVTPKFHESSCEIRLISQEFHLKVNTMQRKLHTEENRRNSKVKEKKHDDITWNASDQVMHHRSNHLPDTVEITKSTLRKN